MDPLSGRNTDLDFDWSVEESVVAVVEVVVVRLVFVGVLPFETLLLICQFHPEGFLICRYKIIFLIFLKYILQSLSVTSNDVIQLTRSD
jgi:hypothetical protein